MVLRLCYSINLVTEYIPCAVVFSLVKHPQNYGVVAGSVIFGVDA
jgi:hypothetical protein